MRLIDLLQQPGWKNLNSAQILKKLATETVEVEQPIYSEPELIEIKKVQVTLGKHYGLSDLSPGHIKHARDRIQFVKTNGKGKRGKEK